MGGIEDTHTLAFTPYAYYADYDYYYCHFNIAAEAFAITLHDYAAITLMPLS